MQVEAFVAVLTTVERTYETPQRIHKTVGRFKVKATFSARRMSSLEASNGSDSQLSKLWSQ